VAIGDPGNAAQSAANRTHAFGGDGYGAVDYTYRIARDETTIAQYTALLNAVAATDTYNLYNPNMVGNVWEWNDLDAESSSTRGVRGGSWGNVEDDLRSSGRFSLGPSFEGSSIGFRVASIPEPSALVLTILFGTACVTRRKR